MNGYVGSAYSNNGPATITIDTAVTVAQTIFGFFEQS